MSTFDPACEFLLTSNNHESLFELSGSGEDDHRCKGCRKIVKRWHRHGHWADHKVLLARAEVARKAQLKVERLEALARARRARKAAKEAA
jgi:hypothetical protein